jgi:hypothetical protein
MTTYLGSGDESRHDRSYRPAWLDRLAEDVTLEAAVMNGVATGAEAVRTILGFAKTLYDYQEFEYAGEYGEPGYGFAEDYSATFRGEPIANVVIVRYNEAGETQHIVISHRPLNSVVLWSQVMAEHFAGTPYAQYFSTADQLAALAKGAASAKGAAAGQEAGR